MRELRVVYNPKARRGRFTTQFDRFAREAQARGFRLSLYRLSGQAEDVDKILLGLGDSSILVTCGGDGTLQLAASAQVAKDMDIPVGVLPYGTSNDFADSLGLSVHLDRLLNYIDTENVYPVDLGMAGPHCFVNVFSAGQLIKASHEVQRGQKDLFGMLAYYLHGIGQLPKMAPFPLTLRGDIENDLICQLLLVVNSTNAGGLKNVAPKADLSDGFLNIIAIKECPLPKLGGLFFNILRGEHLNHPLVTFAKAARLDIEGPPTVETDIDGEKGPCMPLKIRVLPQRLKIFGAIPAAKK